MAWNGRDYTHTFLTSCCQLAYPHYRIIPVDNGSTEDTAVLPCGLWLPSASYLGEVEVYRVCQAIMSWEEYMPDLSAVN